MLREHDERAKIIVETTLDLLGDVFREFEIPTTDAQRVDLWLQRRPEPPSPTEPPPRHLRLLAALFCEDAIIEVFSEAVRLSSFYETLGKQYNLRRYLEAQAHKRREAAATPDPQATPHLPPPWLWVLSAGRPLALFDAYQFAPRPEAPTGVYQLDPGLRVGLIVIAELPPGPETLLLRLMGKPATRDAALAELRRMALDKDQKDDPETQALLRVEAALRHTLRRATTLKEQESGEDMTAAWAEFEAYEKQLFEKGREKGREQGIEKGRKALLAEQAAKYCSIFQIPLTNDRQRELRTLDEGSLTRLVDHLVATRSWPND